MLAAFAAPLRRSAAALIAAMFVAVAAPPAAYGQAIKDPENTLILRIGLGYDSQSDPTPRTTGEVIIELTPQFAPTHVARIKELAEAGWYDGKKFHRVIDGFMAQTGSPRGDGLGGAAGRKNLKAEISDVIFERGVVGMARGVGMHSANSQFFIMFDRVQSLDKRYTVVGRVISGMDVVDRLQRTQKRRKPLLGVTPDRIVSAKIAADG